MQMILQSYSQQTLQNKYCITELNFLDKNFTIPPFMQNW